jgi:hypothetical protein
MGTGIHPGQLRALIQETLKKLDPEVPYSEAAVELLMLTAAAESALGHYITQPSVGPARGIFQIQPEMQHDIFINWLVYEQDLLRKVNTFNSVGQRFALDSIGNIPFQIVYARLIYLRVEAPLPVIHFIKVDPTKGGKERILTHRSIRKLAKYWDRHFNTKKKKGTEINAVRKYKKYVLGK